MPIRDTATSYSKAQALSAMSVGNNNSTNDINQLAAGDAYDQPWLQLVIETLATSGGGATLAVNLITDSAPGYATAPVTYPLVAAVALASLTAGAVLYRGMLPQGMKQYRKLQYVVGTAVFTGGTVTAAEYMDVQTNRNQ